MGTVHDLTEYRKRKLARLEAEYDEAMRRCDELTQQNKKQFAQKFLDKAKALRPQIDKLRGPWRPQPVSHITAAPAFLTNHNAYNFGALSPFSVIFPKPPQVTPSPSNE